MGVGRRRAGFGSRVTKLVIVTVTERAPPGGRGTGGQRLAPAWSPPPTRGSAKFQPSAFYRCEDQCGEAAAYLGPGWKTPAR